MRALCVLEDESEYIYLIDLENSASFQHFLPVYGYRRDDEIDKGVSWTRGDMATS